MALCIDIDNDWTIHKLQQLLMWNKQTTFCDYDHIQGNKLPYIFQ